MSAAELLRQLRSLGVSLRVQGGELKLTAPKGVLNAELRDQLRSHKAELSELLAIADTSKQPEKKHKIPLADRSKPIPLSFTQQRMWFLEEFEGGSSVYNIPWAMRLKGELNKPALQVVLDVLVARHESLRTVFVKTDAEPVQKVLDAMPVIIEEIKLPAADESAIQKKLEAWSQETFDLEQGPLLRVRLIRLAKDDHVLMMTIHHIVSDAWSLDVLQSEFFGSYFAATEGRAASFAKLPLQFADYAVWQRDFLQGDELQRQLAYWTDKLRGAPPLLELPTDHPRPPEQSYRGARRRRLLSVELRDNLKALAKLNNATLFMVLLAAFDVLVARYSGQDDVVVGTPIAGRQQTELEGLIGLFLNTLALRADVSAGQSFNDLLAQVQNTALDAYAHQELPFDKVVDALQPTRDMSHSPVFQVQFMLQNAPASGEPLDGLDIQSVEFEYGTAKFDLTLATGETPDGLMAEIEYATDLFDAVTIERMLEHYERLLYAITANPATLVSELPLSGPADLAILAQWNDTAVEYPQGATLQTLFETQVEQTPAAIALTFADAQLSYAELNEQANRLAGWLQANGVVADSMVGVYMERSIEMVVALLGIIKAGGAYVPLDPDYPEQRIQHMLEDADMLLLLTQSHLTEQLPAHALMLLELDTAAAGLAEYSAANPATVAGPANLAYAIFTSGSTGRPKGVMNEHHGIVNRLLWMQSEYQLNAADRVLQKTPFSFDVSVWEFFWPLLTGAGLVVARPGGHKDSGYLIEVIRKHAITTLHFVPSMLQVFLQDESAASCSSLSRVVCSGEALPHDLQTRFFAAFNGAELHNLYGPTEAAIDVTYWACQRDSADTTVPIGRPVDNTRIHVVEPNGRLAPIGVAGELWIAGEQVARGYANRPELTAERFVPDPFADEQGASVYRTGDLVRWRNDGVLEFLGRIDHQVKLRGFRIELGEIEATLDALPQVEQSLVLLREDVPGNKRLVAYVTGAAEAQPEVPAMRAALKNALPEYMVPAVFMPLPEFPLLPNGKVDRKTLPEPEGKRDVDEEFIPASTGHEQTLAAIWSDLLRVERVGVNDNFFELGGDSILSIQIIARAAKAGLHLTPKQVFKHQTVAELAAVVGTAAVIDAEQGVVTGVVPFLPVQHWFLQQGETDLHHFNQSVMLEVNTELSAQQIETVLTAIHQHHDALRLKLLQHEGEWLQRLDEAAPLPQLEQVDLSGMSEAESAAAVQDECNLAQASIALASGNLLATRLFVRGKEQPSLLMLAIHHLAIDGIGWRILFEDLETVGLQVSQGKQPQLPAKTSSYQAWAQRLQDYAGEPLLDEQLEYWRHAATGVGSLPVDKAAGVNTVGSARSIQIELSDEQTSALLKEVPRAYRTRINDVLLAALARAIARWCDQQSCLIDLEGHGREELFDDLDVSRTLGWFTSIYPVKLALATERDPGADLKLIKEQLRNVPGNGLGYGLLRYTSACKELQSSPQAQILFNYLGQFDQALGEQGLFDIAPVAAGMDQGADRLRSHLLDINGSILRGQLRIGITYSEALHNEVTIQQLATCYEEELQALIEHCLQPDNFGRTPADFPLCELDQGSVDRIIGHDTNVLDIYPVTPMQHGILFHSIYEASRDAYLSQIIWKLQGHMDVQAFGKAWQLIVDRHSVLRTGIVTDASGEPLQVAYRHIDVPLQFADWSDLPAEQREQSLQDFLAADRDESFDLAQPPLIRLNLFAFANDEYRFVWTYHHIVIDGWSVPVVIGELMDAYQSFTAGRLPDLSEVRPFGDYVAWLCAQEYADAETFWRDNLAELEAPTELPAAIQAYNPALGQVDFAQCGYSLAAEVTQGLKDFARTNRLTLNTLVQGVLSILLSRYSAEEQVIFGATTSGRPADLKHVESMVGLFINALPIATQVPAEQTVLEWLSELQDQQLIARQYEFVSLVEVQGWSAVPRGTPLFNTLLVFENYPDVSSLWTRSNESLAIKDMQPIEWNNYPLTVAVSVGEQLHIRLDFDKQYYLQDNIDQIAEHFLRLLEGVVADSSCRIHELPMMDAAEQQKLLVDWNDTALDYPANSTMHGLFETQAAAQPDAGALYAHGIEYSYAELNRRANKLAAQLIAMGVGSEQLVGVCIERRAEMLIGLLAILKAGGAYVPIDPNYPAERVAFMLKDSEAPVLLSQSSLQSELPEHNAEVVCLDTFDWTVSAADDTNPAGRCGPENLGYTIYTSGSTGLPKGVEIEHRNAAALIHWARSAFDPSEFAGTLASTSICFDLSVFEIFVTLSMGGRIVLVRDALELPSLPDEAQVTLINTVPSAIAELVRMQGIPASVRTVNLAGEPLATALVNDIYAIDTIVDVNDLYGPSEDTTYSTWARREANAAPTIGRPIANTQAYLLDAFGQPVPTGVIGELYLGGRGVTRGYRNRPELTAEKYLPDPFSIETGARLYRTGDQARYRRDGSLEFLGRIDQQIKLRGFRIELGEIEAGLSEQAGVKEAVVIVREDTPGDQRLVAYVTAEGAAALDVDELRSVLSASLPAYMVPAAFVVLDEIPLTPNGKTDRKALPAPEFAATNEYVAPRTPVEETLATIWSDVLGVEQVGIHDDFFALGGHSLLATKVMSRVRDELGVGSELRQLFLNPTIAAYGALLDIDAAADSSSPIPVTEHANGAVLSFAQQRMWFLDKLESSSTAYNIVWPMHLTGALDVAAMNAAFNRLAERHESLRTTFVMQDDQSLQLIAERVDIELPVVDMRAAGDEQLQSYLSQLAGEHYDLTAGPLFGGSVLTLNDDDHILVISIHHIIADAWSMEIVYRELVTFYAAELDKVAANLPSLPIQYADYAIWQKNLLGSAEIQQQLDYWKDRLSDAPPHIELPTDYSRPPEQTYNGSSVANWLSPELTAGLRSLAQQKSTTLFVLLQTVFSVLLARYSGHDDIVMGTPIDGRKSSELEGIIGLFLNTLVLRTDLAGNPAFDALLAQVRDNTYEAYEYQDVPFEQLVEELQPVRDRSHAPIFQVMFTVVSPPGDPQGFRELQVRPVAYDSQTAKFDLLLAVNDLPDELGVSFEYNTDLFAASSIESMSEHFQRLLEGVVADASCRIQELPMMGAAEQQKLLVDWNDTHVEYPASNTLVSLFEAQVTRTPDAVALVFAGEQFTYADLNASANQLAHHLQGCRVGTESLVGICMERSFEMVVAIYGILKAGAAYVPLDPEYPQQRLQHMLEDADISLLLSQSHLAAHLPEHDARIINLDAGTEAVAIAKHPTTNLPLVATAANAAYVIFTSGSTGRPKGVLNEHQGICNRLLWMQDEYALDASDRILQKTPFSFDVSVWEFFWPLQTGAALVVAEPGGHRDPAYLAQLIQQQQITTLHFVPSMLAGFLQDPAATDCTSLRRVICSGEALAADLQQRFFGQLDAQLHNLYGPTETAIDVTYWACQQDDSLATVPIGRPVANTQIYIVDACNKPCPVGVPGELLVGGVQVARGYVNRPELTDERFTPDPFAGSEHARVYRTGDLARFRPDGVIEFLGRIDSQVKLRGFRIELGEIEAELQNCSGVKQSAVILREDNPGDQRLVAYIVGDYDTADLQSQLQAALPDYMVPAAFMALDELPLTPNGKLNRSALPAPEFEATTEYVAPRNAAEVQLAELWAAVLGTEQIGVHDDFFALGGHSLLAMQLVSRIRDSLGAELSLADLFSYTTIARLAAKLDTADVTPTRPLLVCDRSQPLPMSFAQQRLWFLDVMEPGTPTYNVPMAVRLEGELDLPSLQYALDRLVERHEALRTTFADGEDSPVQLIHANLPQTVSLHDLSDASEEQALRRLNELQDASFDLTNGPLLRVDVIRLSGTAHILSLCMHHIICDAWSQSILFGELTQFYSNHLQDQPDVLVELSLGYADYAVWQHDGMSGEMLARELGYWEQQLGDAPPLLDMPLDKPRPPTETHVGSQAELHINKAVVDALQAQARSARCTMFVLLLSALNVLLHRYSNEDDIVVGTPISGRTQSELEGIIGFFLNTLAIRTRIDGSASFAELVQQVRATTMDAFANQNLPFEKLVEELQPERNLSHAPVFQVLFIFNSLAVGDANFGGLEIEALAYAPTTAKFDLQFSLSEVQDGLEVSIQYNTDLFEADTIQRMLGHLELLLTGIAENPHMAVGEIPLLDVIEQQQVVKEFNKTDRAYSDASVVDLVESQVVHTPDAVALESQADTLTYSEINSRANRLAHRLIELGAAPGQLIGVCVERCLDAPVAMLAVLKSGAAYVPIDPKYPDERVSYMLADSQVNVLLTQSTLLTELPQHAAKVICIDEFDWFEGNSDNPNAAITVATPAYAIYTSGSTGQPKGVLLPQGGLANLLQWQQADGGLSQAARTLQFASFSFDVSFQEVFSTWQQGGTLIMIDEELRRDLPALAQFVADREIGRMFMPYAALQPLVECMLLADVAASLQLEDVIVAGEQLQITQPIREFFSASGARLHNQYGPSETHVVTAYTLQDDVAGWPSLPPIGQPVANTRAYVLDENSQPLPIGVPGELYIAGVQVGLGYVNRAELTSEKFIADPFSSEPGARMYRTGDRVRFRADGNIDYLGRTDDQLKWRGFRIEPGEIEAVLASHEQVSQAAVLLREDEPGDKRLAAYLVAEEGEQPDTVTIRAFAKAKLPDHMVPSHFMLLELMPLTPSGKVNRKALPVPEISRKEGSDSGAPESVAEKNIARIWQFLLKVDAVYREDNFFDLGGHSLLTIKFVNKVRDATGEQMSIADVFENPTLEELSKLLNDADWDMAAIGLSGSGLVARIRRAIAGMFGLN